MEKIDIKIGEIDEELSRVQEEVSDIKNNLKESREYYKKKNNLIGVAKEVKQDVGGKVQITNTTDRDKQFLESLNSEETLIDKGKESLSSATTISGASLTSGTPSVDILYNDLTDPSIPDKYRREAEEIGETETFSEKKEYVVKKAKEIFSKGYAEELKEIVERFRAEPDSSQYYNRLMNLRSVLYIQILESIPQSDYESTSWYQKTQSGSLLKGRRAGQSKYLVIGDTETGVEKEILKEVNKLSENMQRYWNIISNGGKTGGLKPKIAKNIFHECISDFCALLKIKEDLNSDSSS